MAIKVFISLPMHGKTVEQIYADREKALSKLKELDEFKDQEIAVIENISHRNAPKDATSVWYLGQSISAMDSADYIYFAEGWDYASGCIVEYVVAKRYGLPLIVTNDEMGTVSVCP